MSELVEDIRAKIERSRNECVNYTCQSREFECKNHRGMAEILELVEVGYAEALEGWDYARATAQQWQQAYEERTVEIGTLRHAANGLAGELEELRDDFKWLCTKCFHYTPHNETGCPQRVYFEGEWVECQCSTRVTRFVSEEGDGFIVSTANVYGPLVLGQGRIS